MLKIIIPATLIIILLIVTLIGAAMLFSSAFSLLKTTGSLVEVGQAAIAGALNILLAIILVLIAVALMILLLELGISTF
ncbi:MAG: hypothetical protein QXH10_09240 [Ignisphaera sp.]|uniref:Uncharacterized protein n=1 Tax=Ligamenvirales sp. TaxID=2832923 RepID=A0AAU6PXB6_9VIRU